MSPSSMIKDIQVMWKESLLQEKNVKTPMDFSNRSLRIVYFNKIHVDKFL